MNHLPKKKTYDKKHKGIAKPNWSNDEKKKKYANLVSGKIPNIPPIDIHELTRDDIKDKLNERLEHINSILISTAKEDLVYL